MGKVFFKKSKLVPVGSRQIKFLKEELKKCPDRKARICLHDSFDNTLQEMLIIHGCGAYVRPHKHVNKDESISIIEGRCLLVIFNQKGKVKRRILLDAKCKRRNFICRVGKGVWHSLVVLSNLLVFHEVSSGPFLGEKEYVFSKWSPDHEKIDEVERFVKYISAGSAKS